MPEASDAALARRALALLDLTDLSDNASEDATRQLCAKAKSPPVSVAAVCIWPQHVSLARRLLEGSSVRMATVVNFPSGDGDIERVVEDIAEAISDGADEIDIVLPWKTFLAGDRSVAGEMLAVARDATADTTLKVILETGSYPDRRSITAASELAIACGADFLKTSTGKTPISATPEAAEAMLEVIRLSGRSVGFKASGGIRTLGDAARYLGLADDIMGAGWASPATFRFGASGLHDALVAAIEGTNPSRSAGEIY